jgi:hypothetical protein
VAVVALLTGVVRELVVRADIRAGVYRRIIGPITLTASQGDEGSVTYAYQIGGQSFHLDEDDYTRLRHMTWGSVEYAPRSTTVFALRDEAGAQVYPRRGVAPQ